MILQLEQHRDCPSNTQLTCLGVSAICRLVRVADDQNHSRPESRRIPVIALQSGHCGLVGTRNRVERFALFDLVLNDAGTH